MAYPLINIISKTLYQNLNLKSKAQNAKRENKMRQWNNYPPNRPNPPRWGIPLLGGMGDSPD